MPAVSALLHCAVQVRLHGMSILLLYLSSIAVTVRIPQLRNHVAWRWHNNLIKLIGRHGKSQLRYAYQQCVLDAPWVHPVHMHPAMF